MWRPFEKRPWLRKAAWALAILVLALVGVWTVWNVVGTRRIEQAVDELRAAGFPGRIDEIESWRLGGEPPAAEENAAPLYRAAFALIEAEGKPPPAEDDTAKGIRRWLSDELEAALPDYGPALEELHRAAARPRCRRELRWEDGYELELPDLMPARSAARLLGARALGRSRSGEHGGAVEDLRALFALARSFREEPILISQLVRFGVDRIGLDVLEVVLPTCTDPVAVVEGLRLDAVGGSVAMSFAMESVIVLSLATGGTDMDGAEELRLAFGAASILGPYLKCDIAHLSRGLTRMAVAAQQPYPVARPETQRIQDEALEGGGLMTGMLLPAMAHSIEKEGAIAARCRLASVAARCLAHRRKEGVYPESLDEVSTDIVDPLSGRPFLLERRAGELVLASRVDEEVRWALPEE